VTSPAASAATPSEPFLSKPIILPTAAGKDITCEAALLEANNLRKQAMKPITVAAALEEGGGNGGDSGGRFGVAGSIVIKAIKVTSGTSMLIGTPLYGIQALNSLILRHNLALEPGIEPPSATASLAAAAKCFKCKDVLSTSAI
jgi:hypothetical protein